jgi:CheY-like chemotaxis protein
VGERIVLATSDESDGALVSADPSQLDQVIVNLVVNARHAMPDGGALTIVTSRASVDPAAGEWPAEAIPGDHVVVEVRDTGVGMDADTLARIFEPFFSTREPGQGSGLGLATVDGIVRQSGGFITVASAPGHGAAFRVHLPAVAAPLAGLETRPAGPATRAAPGGTESILVVEDDRAVRTFVARTLAAAGYAVHEAASGERALEVAAGDGALDLLLTDLRMPGIQGRELADRLIAVRPDMRVLLMTGFDEDAGTDEDAAAGGRPLIHKPFGAEDLATTVRAILDSPA